MSRGDVGRNDPCPCGSGAKYKYCCLHEDDARRSTEASKPEPWRRELRETVEQLRETGSGMGLDRDDRRTANLVYEAWQTLDAHLPESVTAIDEVEAELDRSLAPVAVWLQKGIDAWIAAAGDAPEPARMGADFVGAILERFSDESRNYRRGLEADRGVLMAQAGQCEEAEAIFERLVEERPKSPAGYARWADALLEKEPADPQGAVAILERALNEPVDNPESWDLEMRLEEAKKQRRWED